MVSRRAPTALTSVRLAARSIVGSPRRSATVIAIVALVTAVTVAQIQVAAGLRGSVRGTLADPAQRTVVVAAPAAFWSPPAADVLALASRRIGTIAGVVTVATAFRFVDSVGVNRMVSTAQVGWVGPQYLALVGGTERAASAVVSGGGALVPPAVRKELRSAVGDQVVVGSSTLTDLGDAPSSFADPGLRDALLVPVGLVGASARFDTGTMSAAVRFDHIPTDRDVRLVRTALLPDVPAVAAVVSRGSAPETADRLDALAGSSGRLAVLVVVAAAWLIVWAVHLIVAHRRRSDLAVRRVLGATRSDLAVVAAVESSVLGVAGGLLGTLVIGAVLVVLAASDPSGPVPGGPVASVVAILVAATSTLVAGVVPTLIVTRPDPADVLRSLGDT